MSRYQVLNALSRILQAGPGSEGEPVTDAEKGKERAPELELRMDDICLEKKPSSTLSISTDRLRPPGPSRISWKSPSSVPNSPGSITRSASSPSLLDNCKRSSLRRMSSQSLKVDSPHDTESQRDSIPFAPLNLKPLSPITEVHFPPVRRPSLDSIPPILDSTRLHEGHAQAAHPAFITRTLNRSISQASTSSLRSTASAAPTIPPLDLRPNFQATLGIPPGPRKPRMGGATIPTGTSNMTRPQKYSVIYEDGASARTSSFVTAPSDGDTEPQFLPEDVPHMDEPGYALSVHASAEGTDDVPVDTLPAGLYDVPLTAEPRGRPTSVHTHPSASASQRSTSPTESIIHKRWLKGVSFGSDRFVVPSARLQKWQVTTACVLFWLGFVGPWCWLIGGWILSEGEETRSGGKRESLLPLWARRGKRGSGEKGKMPAEKGKLLGENDKMPASNKKTGRKSWYPLVAPSLETLTPSVHSDIDISFTPTRRMKRDSRVVTDPWIFRCRVAAIASGICILAAFIVALVFAGGVRA
ncbi:predicted protein [Sparassis crispa]|uniref:Uncharacterized protein n=1 Tax=Sparassis crispa TaxID=139825 RepID=A0A401GMH0_9APHY|nr:predicted protein [Sparassis crispa]GBE83427.1 predicted protein [Sparassis crispa]